MAFLPALIAIGVTAAGVGGMAAVMGAQPKPANQLSIESVNKVINDAITNFAPNTTTNLNYTNYLNVSGGGSAINNTQYIDAVNNIQSMATASQNITFDTELTNTISQELTRNSVALLSNIGGMFSNNNIDLETKIQNEIHNMHLSNIIPLCVSNQNLTNTIIVNDGSAINNSQTIKSDFYQNCINNFQENMSTISNVTNTLNQKATVTEENPLSFLSDIFGSIGTYLMVFIIIAICIGLVFAYKKFISKDKQNTLSKPNMPDISNISKTLKRI